MTSVALPEILLQDTRCPLTEELEKGACPWTVAKTSEHLGGEAEAQGGLSGEKSEMQGYGTGGGRGGVYWDQNAVSMGRRNSWEVRRGQDRDERKKVEDD